MKFLGLDTTRKVALLYIYDSEKGIKQTIRMSENIKHSEGVFLFLEKALFDCKMNVNDFDYFCGVVGPGSFTGIRVGMSILKGFNMITKNKLLPITTFEILAKKHKKGVVLLNSTGTSCYYAKVKSGEVIDAGVVSKENVTELACGDKVIILSDEQESIGIEYNNIEVESDIQGLFFDCVINKISSGETSDFLPYYLQLSQAERSKLGE